MNNRSTADMPCREPSTRVARRLASLFAIAGLLLSVSVSAALYKWTDANGRIVYSDQPPPGNVKSEQLNAAPPPANPNAVREMANDEALLQKRQAERAQLSEKDAKAKVEADRRTAACARTAGQLRELAASQQAIYRINERGERVVLDDAGRAQERQRLEAWLKANCSR